MPDNKDVTWSAFHHEFSKIAANASDYARVATYTGGALGFAHGALGGYREAREGGADLKDSLIAGGKKGLLHGAVGAGAAGLIGHGLNRDFHVPNAIPLVGGNKFNPAKAIHDYGGHQYHILTGHGKASDYGAGKAWVDTSMAPGPRQEAARKIWDEVERKDLTSIPGVVKGMATHPIDTTKLIAQSQWHGTAPWEKALTIGAPVGMGALSYAMAPEEDKGKSIGSTIAGTAAGMLPFNPGGFVAPMASSFGGLPSVGDALYHGANRVGTAAGGVVDKYRGKVLPPPTEGAPQ